MENTHTDQADFTPKPAQRVYHSPQLISLGDVQTIVQNGCVPGVDGLGICGCNS